MLVHMDLCVGASIRPHEIALVENETRISFIQLDRLSDNIGCYLQDLGIQRGDRVAIMMDNSINMIVALYGIIKAGGVFSPVHPSTKPDKLKYILNDCAVKVLFAHASLERFVKAGASDVESLEHIIWSGSGKNVESADSFENIICAQHQKPQNPCLIDKDLCAIIYTSGSTGFPKGVVLTHRNLSNTSRSISSYLGNNADDIILSVLPLTFDYGLFQVLTGILIGFTVVLEKSFAFPLKTLQRLIEVKATGFPGVPTIFSRFLDLAEKDPSLDFSSLRYVSNTAAALPPAHIDKLQALMPGATIYSMYGLTECTRVSYLDPDRLHDKRGSIGKAIPNCEVYLVDEFGKRLRPGNSGELVVRGSNVMSGYWGNQQATDRCLRAGELPGEKVLYTGDRVYMDDEGFMFFEGRADDLFKSKGEKIYPKEIELVLYELEAVESAAVFGVEDAYDGQAIVACIALKSGQQVTRAEALMHCRKNLESYMVPKHIVIRTELPKSMNGKIDKKSLIEDFFRQTQEVTDQIPETINK